jgi:hypothetical protein
MWFLLYLLFPISIAVGGYVYQKYFRYNDHVTELLTFTFDDLKCIKYQYRGKKYIYLTNNLKQDIEWIQNEIDVNSNEKDKLPSYDYTKFNIQITNPDEKHEIILVQPDLLYAFMGPSNTYYFAFDSEFNSKLTKFMNYIFYNSDGIIMYGHFSALLEPQKYFDIKTRIDTLKVDSSIIEWIIC